MATKEIEKLQRENEIRLSIYKHRGDLAAVCKECSIKLSEAKKIKEKIKQRPGRDVDFQLANSILQHLLMGYEQRVGLLNKYLVRLDDIRIVKASSCCHAVYSQDGKKFKCTECNKECKIVDLDKMGTYRLLLQIVDRLRREDIELVAFAKDLGYVNPSAPVPPVVHNPLILVQQNQITGKGDQKFLNKVTQLTPLERRRLLKTVTSQIVVEDGKPRKKVKAKTKKAKKSSVKKS